MIVRFRSDYFTLFVLFHLSLADSHPTFPSLLWWEVAPTYWISIEQSRGHWCRRDVKDNPVGWHASSVGRTRAQDTLIALPEFRRSHAKVRLCSGTAVFAAIFSPGTFATICISTWMPLTTSFEFLWRTNNGKTEQHKHQKNSGIHCYYSTSSHL